jgi:hypothetical protein
MKNVNMKFTATGCRISRNGSIITSIEKEALKSDIDLGKVTKQNGEYYFFNRKQGNVYVYLP